MALAIILEKQFQEQFNMGEFSPLNIALAVGEEKSPGGWKMIFKASHRAGAEPFLKTKSLHIRAFLIQSSIAFHIIKEPIPNKRAEGRISALCFCHYFR